MPHALWNQAIGDECMLLISCEYTCNIHIHLSQMWQLKMEKNDHHLKFKSLEKVDGLVDVVHVLCNHKEQEAHL